MNNSDSGNYVFVGGRRGWARGVSDGGCELTEDVTGPRIRVRVINFNFIVIRFN